MSYIILGVFCFAGFVWSVIRAAKKVHKNGHVADGIIDLLIGVVLGWIGIGLIIFGGRI